MYLVVGYPGGSHVTEQSSQSSSCQTRILLLKLVFLIKTALCFEELLKLTNQSSSLLAKVSQALPS